MHLLGFLQKTKKLTKRKKDLLSQAWNFVNQQNFAAVPAIFAEISELSADSKTTPAEFARCSEKVSGASLRLVIAANSAYFGAGTNAVAVHTVEEAIARLGIARAREIVESTLICALFRKDFSAADYSASALWLNSVAAAISNRLVFSACSSAPKEFQSVAYLAGLIRNIGISIGHQCLSDQGFQIAVEQRAANDSLLADEEKKHIGISHPEIGEYIALKWNLPQEIVEVIGHHHDLRVSDKRCLWLIHATRVSEWIAFKKKLGYSDFSIATAGEYFLSREFIGASEENVSLIAQETASEIGKLESLSWFQSLNLHVL